MSPYTNTQSISNENIYPSTEATNVSTMPLPVMTKYMLETSIQEMIYHFEKNI